MTPLLCNAHHGFLGKILGFIPGHSAMTKILNTNLTNSLLVLKKISVTGPKSTSIFAGLIISETQVRRKGNCTQRQDINNSGHYLQTGEITQRWQAKEMVHAEPQGTTNKPVHLAKCTKLNPHLTSGTLNNRAVGMLHKPASFWHQNKPDNSNTQNGKSKKHYWKKRVGGA